MVQPLARTRDRLLDTGMSDQITPAAAQSSAALAFEELRGEVSLLRRAIEGLTSERQSQPDYGPTLEALVRSNEELREWARKVSERPAIKLTPARMAEEIEQVAFGLRARDQRVLELARGLLAQAADELKLMSAGARAAYEQGRLLKIVGIACFLGGMLLWPLLTYITFGMDHEIRQQDSSGVVGTPPTLRNLPHSVETRDTISVIAGMAQERPRPRPELDARVSR